jgi:hypothetical protein
LRGLARVSIVPLLALTWGVGCSDGPTDDGGFELDVQKAPDPDAGFAFEPDLGAADLGAGLPADASGTTDGGAEADGGRGGAGDGDAAPVDDAARSGDATGADDTASGPVTACFGFCGVYLEDNPCHCHHGCVAEGNCCPGFSLDCACSSDADCDDDTGCTKDDCDGALCKQIPLLTATCCSTDAECTSTGDACAENRCIKGVCTLDILDCDDGSDCTVDACDSETGTCQHKPVAGKCAIGGACISAGQPNPNAAACALCDPQQDATGWSVKPDFCLIEGQCVKDGSPHPQLGCAACDPLLDAGDWSGVPGTCAIDGACYAAGDTKPDAPCLTCDPAGSGSGWTLKDGHCFVAGVCAASGDAKPGSGGCLLCDPALDAIAWQPLAEGSACDDGEACTTGETCSVSGLCLGEPVAGCCTSDADCLGEDDPGTCKAWACNEASGSCVVEAIADCCTSGQCCDELAQKLQPTGAPCGIKNGVEYRCADNNAEKRDKFNGCTGTDPTTCSSAIDGFGPWTLSKTCSPGTVCTLSSPAQAPVCKSQ